MACTLHLPLRRRSHRLGLCQHLQSLHADVLAPLQLSITLSPAVAAAAAAAAQHPYPLPSNTAPGAFPHFAFVRKPASDFGWDWGPALAPAGLHGHVWLESYSVLHLAGVLATQLHRAPEQQAGAVPYQASPLIALDVEAEVWAPPLPPGVSSDAAASGASGSGAKAPAVWRGTLAVEVAGVPGAHGVAPVAVDSPGRHFVRTRIWVARTNVSLWWPAGHGDQPQYALDVVLRPAGQACVGGGAANDPCSYWAQ